MGVLSLLPRGQRSLQVSEHTLCQGHWLGTLLLSPHDDLSPLPALNSSPRAGMVVGVA